ncbi:hypothetical protein HDV01_002900 [Terramyces sp. JEL0728]|nr:hypothetical protein HDV01_002900 [Terramyces sp. JEL0728]
MLASRGINPKDYLNNIKTELKKSKNWKRLRNHTYGENRQEFVEQLIVYLLKQNKQCIKCIKYGMNRNIMDTTRYEMWLALSNGTEPAVSTKNSLDIFEQCLDFLNQRPWSHHILTNYKLVSLMEQCMVLQTDFSFDIAASITIPVLTVINSNEFDENHWKKALNDMSMPSIGDWIIWTTHCLVLHSSGASDDMYAKLSEITKPELLDLMEKHYVGNHRKSILPRLDLDDAEASSADESEYIRLPQYEKRVKIWYKSKNAQRKSLLKKWKRKVSQVIIWLKYIEELKQLAFTTKMRNMQKPGVVETIEPKPEVKEKPKPEIKEKPKPELKPAEKPKKTSPLEE